jgi:hypothetical protein
MRAMGVVCLFFVVALMGCEQYTESQPTHVTEGADTWNYARVFDAEPAADVTIVHSMVMGSGWTTACMKCNCWEFELLAPCGWVADAQNHFCLRPLSRDMYCGDVEHRAQHPIRDWYYPEPMSQYDMYRDLTSAGYVHMLVRNQPEQDGRYRVYISRR